MVRHSSWSFVVPPPPVFAASPSQPLENGDNAALIGGADAGRFQMQGLACDLANGYASDPIPQTFDDGLFPRVKFVSGLLLRRDVFGLKVPVGPPGLVLVEERNGLCE